MDNHSILFPNVVEQEAIQVGEISASVLSLYDGEKHVMFFNQTEGYIGEMFLGGKVSNDELVQVLEGLSVTMRERTETETMTEAEIEQALAEGLEVPEDVFNEYLEHTTEETIILKEDIHTMGDTVSIDTWYALEESKRGTLNKTLNNVQVLDALDYSKYSQEFIIPWEDNQDFIQADGTLKPVIKNILDETGNIIGTEEVELVWIVFDVTVENKTDQTLEKHWSILCYCKGIS